MDRRPIPYRIDRIALVFGSPTPMRPFFLAQYARSFDGEWRLDSRSTALAATTITEAQVEASGLLPRSGTWVYARQQKGLRDGYWVEVGPGE